MAAPTSRLARWLSYPSPKMAKAAQSADLQAAFKKHEGDQPVRATPLRFV
jgi:hypothetical protein